MDKLLEFMVEKTQHFDCFFLLLLFWLIRPFSDQANVKLGLKMSQAETCGSPESNDV